MGKAQSKRSVDITTEATKDAKVIEEGTAGKMGKIEDVDQLKPQLNGDSHHNDKDASEKEKTEEKDNDNEKHTVNEKEATTNGHADDGAGGDSNPINESQQETLNESKVSEATSPTSENGDSKETKKPKKEKVKKKWSIRSLSFNKKDKQKPPKDKKEETNGEIEKVPEEPQQEATVVSEVVTKTETTVEVVTNGTDKKEEDEKKETEKVVETVQEPEKIVEENKPISVEDKKVETVATVTETVISEPKKEEKIVEECVTTTSVTVSASATEEKNHIETKTEVITESNTASLTTKESVMEVTDPELIKQLQQSGTIEHVVEEMKQMKIEEHITEVKKGNEFHQEEKIKSIDTVEVVEDIKKDVESIEQNPPPLPTIPPPSQVTMFAETAMSPDVESVSAPSTVATTLPEEKIEIDNNKDTIVSELKPETVAEISCEKILDHVQETIKSEPTNEIVEEKSVDHEPATVKEEQNDVLSSEVLENVENSCEASVVEISKIDSEISTEIVDNEKEAVEEINTIPPMPELPVESDINNTSTKSDSDDPKPEQIAETIALIEKVTEDVLSSDEVNSLNDSLPPPPPVEEENKDISIDISSPLPQNSLDSLPSPSSKSECSLPLPPSDSINIINDVAAAQIDNITNTNNVSNENINSEIIELPPPIDINDDVSKPIPVESIPKEEIIEKLNGDIHNEQHVLTNGEGKQMNLGQQQIVSDKIETKTEVITTESTIISSNTEHEVIKTTEESVQEKCPSSPSKEPEVVAATE